MAAAATQQRVIYEAQAGPQSALISCPIEDVFFGGARGGGKTYGLLGDWISHADLHKEHARGIFFRRTYPELDEVQDQASRLFPALGAAYNVGKRLWLWPNGAQLKMRYLERESDPDRYQGHAYCVAVGTPVLMADGSYKPIEGVQIGEEVMTLEGAKPVTARLEPYGADCVAAFVYDSSGFFSGVQVHPWRHPILTTAAMSGESLPGWFDSEQQPHLKTNAPYRAIEEFHRGGGRESRGWLSFLRDGRTDYKESPELRRAQQRPLLWCDSVVLYAQSNQSETQHSDKGFGRAIRFGSLGRSLEQWLDLFRGWTWELLDQLPRSLLAQSIQQIVGQLSPNAPAYAADGKRAVPDSRCGYPSGHGSYGERARTSSGSVQYGFRPQGDAARPFPSGIGDESDTIPRHNRSHPEKYLHPYTGEARRLSAAIQVGSVLLVPYGFALVSDLTVADANHYITNTGLINKNTWMAFDELTNWPASKPIDKLRACLRSGSAPVAKSFRASGNPGGVGHNWVKARYVDPAAPMKPFYDGQMECWRVFIPSRLDDNPALQANDPDYWKRVKAATFGNEALEKAWRFGDWDIVAGGMFDDLWRREIHVIEPWSIPSSWTIDRSFDWGSSKPYSVGWWAESDGTTAPNGRTYPRGSLFRIHELYGWNGRPNEGCKALAVEIADQIKETEAALGLKVNPGPADDSVWDEENGNCIARDMAARGVYWTRAGKRPGTRKTGWEKLRKYLKAATQHPMEEPGMFIFSNCTHFIRTVPVLPRDEKQSDDVDTDAEDHVGDETRYRVLQANLGHAY